jgi:acyl homoserine lactone synthase
MLSVISYQTISRNPDLFFGQHQLRHREFLERQRYAVKSFEDMEYDQYDNLASRYLVYSDDGKQVLGCSRLTPVYQGCMLQDLFPEFVDDPTIYTLPQTWEGTRFCVDSRLAPEHRLHILKHISVGYLELALHSGIDRIIGFMQTLVLRSVWERNGIQLRRLGQVLPIGEHSKVQAACIEVSEAQYACACERTGVVSPLGLHHPSEVARHVV